MRPTTIVSMIFGVLAGVFGAALGVFIWVHHSGGKLWFYWIAPLLAIGLVGVFGLLAVQYYMKVGRLETKGRPRSE